MKPAASFSPVLALLTGSGLILFHEDGNEVVVVEVLCGVFGDDLRCGGVLGVLGRAEHVGSVIGGCISPFVLIYTLFVLQTEMEKKRSCEEWDHILFYFSGPTPR